MVDFTAYDDDNNNNNNYYYYKSFLGVGCFPIYQKLFHWPDSQQDCGGGKKKIRILCVMDQRKEVQSYQATYPLIQKGVRWSSGTISGFFFHLGVKSTPDPA